MKVIKKPRISPRAHNLRRRPHQETSYALLTFLVILTGVVLFAFTSSILADPPPPPITSEIRLDTAVLTPPPTTTPAITSPGNGTHVIDGRLEMSGNCEPGRVVRIVNQSFFAGSTICNAAGRFLVVVGLFPGSNTLVATNADYAGQEGPAATPVTVFYDVAPISSALPASVIVPQLQIASSKPLIAGYVGEPFDLNLTISGGEAPYAISVDWGDGTSDVVSRSTPGSFQVSHTYKRAGDGANDSYPIIVAATDVHGRQIFAQFTAIVHSKNQAVAASLKSGGGQLAIAWPILGVAWLMVIVFWLGERMSEAELTKGWRFWGSRGRS